MSGDNANLIPCALEREVIPQERTEQYPLKFNQRQHILRTECRSLLVCKVSKGLPAIN